MKSFIMLAGMMGLTVAVGCNRGTPGGPGATEPESKKHSYDVGNPDNTFTLSVPSSMPLMSSSIKEGETAKVTIGINRNKGFQQDVSLKFEGLPKGVSIDASTAKIPHDKSEAVVLFTAADDAALGSFEVKVLGHPSTGPDAANSFKLSVEKKDTFTISVPTFSTSIKEGETKAVTISIKRDKNFDQDVSLKFANLPKGVSFEPASPIIKNGETDAKIMIKADNDAEVGDFTVKVTGHPGKGADAVHDFKISVARK